jgi:hypothetical protein
LTSKSTVAVVALQPAAVLFKPSALLIFLLGAAKDIETTALKLRTDIKNFVILKNILIR